MKTGKIILPCIIVGLLFASCGCNNNNGTSQEAPVRSTRDTAYMRGNPQNTSRGEEIFQQRCAACHGLNGNYKNNNAADLTVSRIDSISIINTIKNGKGVMPMFAHVMPDSDLAQLELYVQKLRK